MRKKLLLADDSVTIQRVIELTFAGEDVQVLAVGDGEEAIARIPVEKPDIILADIAMPKRSGYEVSAFVKGHPEFEKIPVLLLAGAFEPVDEVKAKEAQCDGVLVKPFEPHHVIARVRELIGGAKGSPMQATPDIPRPAAALAPSRPVELPRRDERPPVPDDLMDIGEDDLLPREDLLAAVQEETSPQPIVLDDSLDDYFDKLDEAFATINTTASTPPGAEARPPRPDRPVLERDLESFDELPTIEPTPPVHHVEPPRVDVTDPFAGIDAIQTDQAARVPTLDDLLAGMPPGPESVDIDFDIETFTSPPVAPSYVEGPATSRVQGPPIEPPDATPTLTAAPPPPVIPAPGGVEGPAPSHVEGPSGRSIIADAFTAMLAAEQGEPGAAMPRLAGNGSSSIAVTDTMIDDVARRVVQKLALGSSEQMQAMVREIVSSVAERLVREEIDRIRGRLHY
ncbi:MAG TPA: response regulator [Vicinamibacterales bacterium]|nr:response regulator [Vicinamibacterales bacterium]